MAVKLTGNQFALPPVLLRGNHGSTSDLLAHADLLGLLDQDVYDELERRSDLTDEDVVVLVNRYLRLALADQSNQVDSCDLANE